MASVKKLLPQGGTSLKEVGESTGATASCPSYSGGGNKRCEGHISTRKENEKITTASEQEMSDDSIRPVRSARRASRFWSGPGKRRRHDDYVTSSDAESVTRDEVKAPIPMVVLDPTLVNRRRAFMAKHQDEASAESEIEELAKTANANHTALGLGVTSEDNRSATVLSNHVRNELNIIHKVAQKSKNLKGTFQRALKESAASIEAAVAVLHSRTSSDEVLKLQANNDRLEKEVAELRKAMTELQEEVQRSRQAPEKLAPRAATPPQRMEASEQFSAPGLVEEVTRSIMLQVGGMINARLEAFEERLPPVQRLRPPLAADRNNAAMATAPPQPQPASMKPQPPAPGPQATVTSAATREAASEKAVSKAAPKTRKEKKGKKKPSSQTMAPKEVEKTPPPTLSSKDDEWVTVTRRSRKEKGRTQRQEQQLQQPLNRSKQPKKKVPKRKPQIRTPNTAAVVITLLPGAHDKGITYGTVIKEARGHIDLETLGVPSLRLREAATGARILTITGAEKGEKADCLAGKLKEVFQGNEEIRITRPVATTDIRVSGLDDSVTSQELVETIAKRGQCDPSAIKAGEIRKGVAGMGTAFVRCPTTVTKKIMASGGRLLVGWVSAEVKILDARPRRCYRCLETGHVGAQCQSEIDRSDECHRCGKKSHKANACTAPPHCTVCAAAGKPAEHLAGGKACTKPRSNRKGVKKKTAATEAKAKPQPTRSQTEQAERMEEQ